MNLSFTVELQSVHPVQVIVYSNGNSSIEGKLYEDSHGKQQNMHDASTVLRCAVSLDKSGNIILYSMKFL